MNSFLISIIIPCYNQGHYLEDCLNSILCQSYKNWEVIVVNDGSTDSTKEIVELFIKKDSRISYIFQSNQGLSAARNSGIKVAKGEFLLFLDSDDWLEKPCLQTFIEAINTNPDGSLFRSGYAYWDQKGGTKLHEHMPYTNGLIFPQVLTSNIGPCHSVLIRKTLALKIDKFDTELKSCEDWDFWMRAGRLSVEIYSIPQVLVAYRYVLDSMSRNPRVMYAALSEVSKRATRHDARINIEEDIELLRESDLSKTQKRHFIKMIGILLHQAKAKEAIEWYRQESEVWNWEIQIEDWADLSSYLTWSYFSSEEAINSLLGKTKPEVVDFFKALGYIDEEVRHLVRMVFEMQFKKLNHLRYGKYLGALRNKLGWY